MTLITHHGEAVAMAGRDRFTLSPHIAALPDGDPTKTWVCWLALYARDVLTGDVPDLHYLPHRAERFARAALIPAGEFRALAGHDDVELAERFNVPLEQIAHRRVDLANPPARHARRPLRRPSTRRRRRARRR